MTYKLFLIKETPLLIRFMFVSGFLTTGRSQQSFFIWLPLEGRIWSVTLQHGIEELGRSIFFATWRCDCGTIPIGNQQVDLLCTVKMVGERPVSQDRAMVWEKIRGYSSYQEMLVQLWLAVVDRQGHNSWGSCHLRCRWGEKKKRVKIPETFFPKDDADSYCCRTPILLLVQQWDMRKPLPFPLMVSRETKES